MDNKQYSINDIIDTRLENVRKERQERENNKKKAKKLIFTSLLIIIFTPVAGFGLSIHQGLSLEIDRLQALPASFNDISPNPLCKDELITVYPDDTLACVHGPY